MHMITVPYYCIHNILSAKGMCSDSRDFFNVWTISDIISITVQDRDIFAMED